MIDTNFINPFLAATLHVLKVQASIEATPGKVTLKKDGDLLLGDVSGVIGLVCENFTGSVVISFPEPTFLKVMSGMLGEEYSELNKEILDGAGEITKLIFGQAKIVLNEKGYGIKTALPSVISGKGHSLSSLSKGPIIVVPFSSPAGEFFVETVRRPVHQFCQRCVELTPLKLEELGVVKDRVFSRVDLDLAELVVADVAAVRQRLGQRGPLPFRGVVFSLRRATCLCVQIANLVGSLVVGAC